MTTNSKSYQLMKILNSKSRLKSRLLNDKWWQLQIYTLAKLLKAVKILLIVSMMWAICNQQDRIIMWNWTKQYNSGSNQSVEKNNKIWRKLNNGVSHPQVKNNSTTPYCHCKPNINYSDNNTKRTQLQVLEEQRMSWSHQ